MTTKQKASLLKKLKDAWTIAHKLSHKNDMGETLSAIEAAIESVTESMKPEIERAMREVLEAWEAPDSPEALVDAIYQMKRIYMAEVLSEIDKPTTP